LHIAGTFYFSPMYQLLEKKQIVYLILILLGISRLIFLSADPSIFRSSGDLSDEFWWASAALIKNNTGSYPEDLLSGALAVGPAYSFILTYWFKVFTTDLFSLRIMSCLASFLSAFTLYHIFKSTNKTYAALTAFGLSLLHLFYAYSRVAQIEMLQLSLFLIVFYMLKFNHSKCFLLTGFLSAFAVLLKVSFIIMIPAVGFLIIMKKRKNVLKEILLFSTGFVFVILPAILFFFVPYNHLFKAYFSAFSNINFSLIELLHPLGIPFRLIYLPNHLVFQDATFALLFIFVLIRCFKKLFSENEVFLENKTFNSLMIVSVVYFFFLLFTDFNERRMVLLLPAITAMLFIPYQIQSSIKSYVYLVAMYVFSLSLIIQLKYYFGSIMMFSIFPEAINDTAFWIIVHLLLFVSYAFVYLKYKYAYKLVFQYIFLCIITVGIAQMISKNYMYWGFSIFSVQYVQLIFFSILICLTFIYVRFNKNQILQLSWLFFAIIIQSMVMFQSTYTIEKMSIDFNSRFTDLNYVAGDNSIFIAAFPHPEKVLPFTGSFKDNPEALVKQFNTYKPEIYLSTKKQGSNTIEFKENLKAIENELGCRFEPIWMYELIPKSLAYKTDLLVFKIIYQEK